MTAPPPPGAVPAPGLTAIMGSRLPAMIRNVLRNLEEETLRVVRGVFVRG